MNGERLLAPQGANGFFVPELPDDISGASSDPHYYAALNIPREFTYPSWSQDNKRLGFCQDNYGCLVAGLQHYGPAANAGRRAYQQLADALSR